MHANLLQLSKKIRVGAVSYLNTKPLLYGLQHHAVSESIELMEDYPANLARALQDNAIDIGLVPVAVIPELEWPRLRLPATNQLDNRRLTIDQMPQN